jgi:hypothetical protein
MAGFQGERAASHVLKWECIPWTALNPEAGVPHIRVLTFEGLGPKFDTVWIVFVIYLCSFLTYKSKWKGQGAPVFLWMPQNALSLITAFPVSARALTQLQCTMRNWFIHVFITSWSRWSSALAGKLSPAPQVSATYIYLRMDKLW